MGDPNLWEKEFPITFVTRADLVRAGARRPMVRALTDRQMRAIATKMSEYYVQHESGQFWEHIQAAVEYVVNQPKQTSLPQTPPSQEIS